MPRVSLCIDADVTLRRSMMILISAVLVGESGERKGSGTILCGIGQPPAPANMRLSKGTGVKGGTSMLEFRCEWCGFHSVSPTVVEQHEEKEHSHGR